jgi:hypothetical protein
MKGMKMSQGSRKWDKKVVGLHEVEIQTEWWFSERGVDI